MPIYFYLLETNPGREWRYTTALLAEQAYRRGHNAYILSESPLQARQLDALLWNYREDTLLPHQRYQPASYNPHIPIQIGDPSLAEQHPPGNILLNLSQETPKFYREFSCVIELVPNEAGRKQKAREKYRIYQREGEELHTQNILGVPELPR